MPEALIGLGGNLGDVRATFDAAVDLLCADAAVRLLASSADFRTPPWGVTDQPAFINRCLLVETMLTPRGLLERVLGIERRLGRNRLHERRWGPRPIDLDILSYDDLTLDEPDLSLPHPQLLRRAFVLVPLAEIAGDRVIGGITIRDALARVDAAGIERLPPRFARE
jgi:2-amino-4-hydroxy-6-hydroxymethyldihydropteridine diphosphokinase